jgi:hypothetical protein
MSLLQLDLQCPPKAHVLKDVPRKALLGGGTYQEAFKSLEKMPFEGLVRP